MFKFIKHCEPLLKSITDYGRYLTYSNKFINELEDYIIEVIKEDSYKAHVVNKFYDYVKRIDRLDLPDKYKEKIKRKVDGYFTSYILPKYRNHIAVM